MSFFLFICIICAINYVFPSLLLRVSSASAFQTIFCVVFQHLKFVQNFQNFPTLSISIPFFVTFYMLCVTFASYTLSVSSSMFVYPIDVFTLFP